MKKYITSLILISLCVALALQPTVVALALGASPVLNYPPIIITEVQAGTTVSASQEFIELYNQSPNTINLTTGGWQVQITSSTATDWSKAKSISLTGLFYPGRYYLLASSYVASGETKSYLQDYVSAQFSSGLSATAGHIRLVNTASLASEQPTQDALEWSTTTNGQPVSAPITGIGVNLSSTLAAGSSIKRVINSADQFLTGDAARFIVSTCPTPTANDVSAIDPLILQTMAVPLPTDVDVANQACITEQDEPNSGGLSQPTTDPPAVLLPDNNTASATTSASLATHIPDADLGLEAPQISEILPNPVSPQTDANDEFIELYNGNQVDFDLSGFVITTASSSAHKFTFPNGTILPAGSFKAWYSRDTGIGLSNSSGQVILYDPLGNVISQTSAYGTAKDGMAWALAQGVWQWTDMPTPDATNIIHIKATASAASSKAKTTATKATASKVTAKTTKTPKTSAKKQSSSTQSPGAQNTAAVLKTPVHIRIIALVGACALLYGAYEYRRDVANRFYEFRSNRAARRAARQGD